MHQYQRQIEIATRRQGLFEFTREVIDIVRDARVSEGVVTVFCQHTSCSLLINENADPEVRVDLEAFLKRLVPDGDPAFIHTLEGPDDMPAHIKTALTATSLSIPIAGGHMALGTWQGIYLFEHRVAPHRRDIIVHVIGS
ncbi:secondary thiamine-phosphate synthase enzyme YjbQ [Aestuariivirga litoralis]|uniref:secondary thiamine-phosphate synthase enzyme YjbQ n=1 Tax=Aestuariivirga litoralis TaxID=2650924 RepID=UPI0018C54C71|nr:secondary thiamine-phosphate synthase enzyme YjbQ [Aestuariivirga litoralis]MBG1231117.1 YjbQ family protein [Aestuariivirga litoralis]